MTHSLPTRRSSDLIQRKISSRAPLQDVLDSITAGASDLLRDEVTGLRLIDAERPDILRLVSSVGVPAGTAPELSQRSAEHTSELQSLMRISYAVFCLQKKNQPIPLTTTCKH